MAKERENGHFQDHQDQPRNRSGRVLIDDLKRERRMAYPLLDQLQARYRNDPHGQAQELLLRMKIPAATGRQLNDRGERRLISEATRDAYIEVFHWTIDQLRELGMPIRNLSELGPKGVRHLLKKMDRDGLSASRKQQVITKLRRWCVWIGKTEAVPPMKQLVAECGLPAGTGVRTYGAQKPKSLRAKGIDFEVVLARAEKMSLVAGLQLAMQVLFGCRVKESCYLEPNKCDEGGYLHIYKGAKGGHERRVEIRTAQQRAWLDRAKAYAEKAPKKLLARRPMPSWPQARNHLYYVAGEIGLTADGELQTTPHGLRHEYLCRGYEEVAGSLPPVEGGVPVDRETHQRASEVTIRGGGHHNKSKIQAYVGNYSEAVRAANRGVQSLYARLTDPRVISELRELGLTGLLVVGDAAAGVIKADAITVCAYECEDTEDARTFVEENHPHLIVLLQMLIGTIIEVVLRHPAHLAAKHTLEIIFPSESGK